MQCYDAMSCLRITVRKLSSFAAVPLEFVRIPGTRSTDAPVLFLHGLFGNKNNWRSIARRVTDECGRTTFCVDLRNHGDSPHTDPDSSVTLAMAEDVKDLLIRERIKSSILVGHSMGGRVALQLAYLHVSAPKMCATISKY
jgi:pimeloyl-ACP methyl ester carboxylesterase